MYKTNESKEQVDTFIKSSEPKIKKKFDFILRYIIDERNLFKEPYVKHFTIEKYKLLYELRLKASGVMVRIIFSNVGDDIILLHAFVKRDKRDTKRALEYSLKLLEQLEELGDDLESQLTEVKIN